MILRKFILTFVGVFLVLSPTDSQDNSGGEGDSKVPDFVQDWLSTSNDEEVVTISESSIVGTLARGHVNEGDNRTTALPRPIQMDIRFSLGGNDHVLQLHKNSHVQSDVPLVVGTEDKLEEWEGTTDNDFTMYSDAENKASIMLRYHILTDSYLVHSYSGSFNVGKDQYAVEPVISAIPRTISRRRRRRDVGEDQENVKHVVYKRNKYLLTDGYETMDNPEGLTRRTGERGGDSATVLEEFYSYAIEMLIVVDYSLYLRWYSLSKGTEPLERKANTLATLKFYYAHVVNGIDMRYSSMNSGNFSIHARLVGYYIATTENSSPFSRDNRENGDPRGTLKGEAAMTDLAGWLRTNKARIPQFDQATLFTGDYVLGLSGNRILGTGIISGICTYYSVAVSRDLGQYPATQTASHELGHNLNSPHDGQDNECSSDDQFIMASKPLPLTDDVYKNAYTFSKCTQREIERKLKDITRTGSNCLLNKGMTLADWNRLVNRLPGQESKPDQQCQEIFGLESFYCGGATEDKGICRKMECYDPQAQYCRSNDEQRAAPGTSCGNHMWCQNGDCVYDELAPEAKDFCTHGDYQGGYRSGLTCPLIKTHAPWRCYDSYYYDDCCESCGSIRQEDQPECEFGDKRNCSGISGKDCLDTTVNSECCSTCSNITACSYSTDATWCSDAVLSRQYCYSNGDDCCWACSKYLSKDKECRYGDHRYDCTLYDCNDPVTREDCCDTCAHAPSVVVPTQTTQVPAIEELCEDSVSWCDVITTMSCYQADGVCCKTCSKFYTGVSECEYGDMYAWCKPQMCESEALRRECCWTCGWHDTTSVSHPVSSSITTTPKTTTTSTTTTTTTTATTTTEEYPILFRPACRAGQPPSFCGKMPARGCYVFADLCCDKCNANRFTGLSACEFGDKVGWCSDVIRTVDDCKEPTITRDCCWTCKLFSIQSEDCFGPDIEPWCKKITPRECYNEMHSCCATCKTHNTNIAGCPYGDRANWCGKYVSTTVGACADENVFHQCCQTCAMLT